MFLSSEQLKTVDRLGAGLSLACAVHCALQPLLLIALPVIGLGFLMNEQLENLFLIFSVSLATWALLSGLRVHGNRQVLWPLSLGIVLIFSSRIFNGLELPLAVAGAIGISTSHILNHLYQQQMRQCCSGSHCHN